MKKQYKKLMLAVVLGLQSVPMVALNDPMIMAIALKSPQRNGQLERDVAVLSSFVASLIFYREGKFALSLGFSCFSLALPLVCRYFYKPEVESRLYKPFSVLMNSWFNSVCRDLPKDEKSLLDFTTKLFPNSDCPLVLCIRDLDILKNTLASIRVDCLDVNEKECQTYMVFAELCDLELYEEILYKYSLRIRSSREYQEQIDIYSAQRR